MQVDMARDIDVGCQCGAVRGSLRDASSSTCNRWLCYCDDCQAFLHHLGRSDLLDAHGGSEVVQVAPRTVSFNQGTEYIVGVRLTAKGMHRWYSSCCKTPLGNTVSPSLPFIGMHAAALRGAPRASDRTEIFGRVRAATSGEFALGGPDESIPRAHFWHLLLAMWRILGWKLNGSTWPHPYYDRATGAPSRPVTVLSPAERDALRSKCGPSPAKPANDVVAE